MSVIKFIICERCKKSLWIGQSGSRHSPGSFYDGEPHTMAALRDFLWLHLSDGSKQSLDDGSGDHILKFVDEYYKDYLPWNKEDGWEQIDANKYRKKAKGEI